LLSLLLVVLDSDRNRQTKHDENYRKKKVFYHLFNTHGVRSRVHAEIPRQSTPKGLELVLQGVQRCFVTRFKLPVTDEIKWFQAYNSAFCLAIISADDTVSLSALKPFETE
jgi:hypothetical protein